MPRGYRTDTIVVAAGTAATYVFNPNLLPQGGLKDLYVIATGANNTLDNAITQVVVKLEGVEVINMTGTQLRVLLEALRISETIPGAGQLFFTIPMGAPAALAGAWPFVGCVSGIPFGLNVSVEISVSAGSSAGTLQIGWTMLDSAPAYMLKCVKQATGVVLNTTSPVAVNYQGNDVLGVILDNAATKIVKLRMVSRLADGREYQISDMSAGMMTALMQDSNPVTVSDPLVYLLEKAYKFGPSSYLEYTTGAAGLASDNFAAIQVVDVRPATA